MKKILIAASVLVMSVAAHASTFVTDGNGLRQVIIGNVAGESVVYVSELDGVVGSYRVDGQKRWTAATDNKAVMFEINTADLNGDGADDLVAASGDGSIYAWDSNGTRLWTFTPRDKTRLNEVAITKVDGEVRVYAGGNNYILYELNSKGELLSETKLDGVVRKIEAGHFNDKTKSDLFVQTSVHDIYRWQFLGFIDPKSKKVIRQFNNKDKKLKELAKGVMITDIDIADLDQDGLDDLLFFAGGKTSKNTVGKFVAYNSKFDLLAHYNIKGKEKQRYAHAYGSSLLPLRNEIMFQFGGVMFLVDPKGKLLKQTGERHRGIIFNDFALDENNKTLLGGGQIGGGNTVYEFDLKNKNWIDVEHKLQGRLAEVEQNLNTLYQQTLDFKMPSYQSKSEKPWVMLTKAQLNKKVQALDGANYLHVTQERWTENWDRQSLVPKLGKIALKKDRRGKYKDTQATLIKKAKAFEKKGENFVIWSGHGNDPFGVSIDTMEAILEAAPTTAMGFLYAEMHNPKDPRVIYFIEEYMPRLAKALRKHGKGKLYFRYKNIFWAATSHQQPWKDMFFSGKYSDILVPSAEDTSSRTQEVNLSGRVGMLLGDYIDDFAMRLVDDNPTTWRPLSPGGQRSVSPYLRNGVLTAAYGSRMGIIFDINYLEGPGLNILFALMKSGVLPIVEKDAMLSVGSWMLMQDVDNHLVHSIDNIHETNHYNKADEDAIISVAQMHWAGANIPTWDYSSSALGAEYRWLNFVPELPNGMVPIAPIESKNKLDKLETNYFITDGISGFSGNKKVSAKNFEPSMKAVIDSGRVKMPIEVTGASWSVVKLDDNHSRIILIDPGYINPQERVATIKFNNRQPKWAKDILSNQGIETGKGTSLVTVPAGSVRFIDVGY
ncbi:hypothetical protein KO525_11870 [Psychrosphaera sp. B3R10]|uniref:hypothetical protein n=1 Tax=unclassified Psychrosphaera TaxID=2641570 RepID=UPI001C0930FD|nr:MULTISPECIES: hypothetical protein [unclassified Psychrosphaera]MBU2881738.1 hypothetical protein [Psychrosphaera sp. I2R16]MBU2990077.1 hypothetical protein [Psychrosphaera sp. B3R10]